MKKVFTVLSMAMFLIASVVVSGNYSRAMAKGSENLSKNEQQDVGLIRKGFRASKKGVKAGYRGTKKGVKAGYRGTRKGVKASYRGTRKGLRAAYRGGRWVTVKTARGTKRVFRRSKKVIY
jgi:hypothetical protein